MILGERRFQMPNDKLLASLALVLVAVVLLRDPHCRCGCRTVAQHLLGSGLDGLLGVLA
jgi:hypothetical protein